MSSDSAREETILALINELRLTSANSVMYSQATADRARLHSTDMECLDHLLLHGPMTAGRLSELTGLTTGTITALIDRLERAGFVRRERGQHDRRQVMVVPNMEKVDAELMPITLPLGMAVSHYLRTYSEGDLQKVLTFLKDANAIVQQEIATLRRKETASDSARPEEEGAG